MKSNLFKRGFLSLIFTQFFGAANDNILKGVLSFGVATAGIWAAGLGEGGQGYVGLCLTVPFILLSGYAGQLADHYSKRDVTVVVKIAEIFIAGVALLGFWLVNLWIALGAMLLLAIQSTFFGPAKYGMIPELVEDTDLSRANGMINMMTNIAVIVGTLAAGPLYLAYYPQSDPNASAASLGSPLLWIPGVSLLGVSLLGLIASLGIPKLKARAQKLVFDWNPFGTYLRSIKGMARGPLLMVALAWAFFYLIGMLAILILPDYKSLLNIDPVRASYLLGILGVAIGIGSVTAGLISGSRIEPRLIPVGAVGMTVFFLALGLVPNNFWLIMGLLLGAGIFAGFYIVPLQALLQKLSPDDERGQFLGTANAISFLCSTIGSLIFIFARKTLHLEANRVFLICAGLALVGTGILIWRMRKLLSDPSVRA